MVHDPNHINKGARLWQELIQAPATANELAAILYPSLNHRTHMRRCSAWLTQWKREGKVTVIGKRREDNGRSSQIYAVKQ